MNRTKIFGINYSSLTLLLVGIVLTISIELVVADDANQWPEYRGPNADFTARCDLPLVREWNDARLVWSSETTHMGKGKFPVSGFGGVARKHTEPLPGGTASPIVYDGKVFVVFFRPSGDIVDGDRVTAEDAKEEGYNPAYYKVGADDCVGAIDAATGKTLWLREFKGEGVNIPQIKRNGWGPTPVAYDGKIFALSTMGKLRAFDASTGKTLWEADNGQFESRVKLKEEALANAKMIHQNKNEEMHAALTVINGVLMVPDWASGIVAFDPHDGRMLWKRKSIRADHTSPASVELERKTFALAALRGTMHLFDPNTGKDRWTIDGLASFSFPLIVHKNHVFVQLPPDQPDQKLGKWAAFALSAEGATKAWVCDATCSIGGDHSPQHIITAHAGIVAFCANKSTTPDGRNGDGRVVMVEVKSGRVIHDEVGVHSTIGHVWGDRWVFRSEGDGDSSWHWYELREGKLVRLDKQD